MILLWLTRGRTWGFRFLRRGESLDPIPEYDSAFAGLKDEKEGCLRVGDRVALRLLDPLGRQDAAGRTIPHDFVLTGDLANQVTTVADGIRAVWPLVESDYLDVYDTDTPPSPRG